MTDKEALYKEIEECLDKWSRGESCGQKDVKGPRIDVLGRVGLINAHLIMGDELFEKGLGFYKVE